MSTAAHLPSFAALLEPANLVGIVALATTCTWPLLGQRKLILKVQVAGALLFALHYLLLGAPSAAAMCALGAVQGVALVLLPRRGQRIAVVAATTVIAMAATATMWIGIASLFSQVGQVAGAVGRLQMNTQRLRLCFLLSVVFWATHNLLVGSVFGLFADGLSATGLLLGLWRNRVPARTAVGPLPARAVAAAA